MSQYVRVVEDESCPDQAIEIPTEPDGTLLLSNIQGQFPGACGLRYRSHDTNSLRGVRLAENTLYPPFEEGWGNLLFMIVPSKIDTASKRKIEESPTGKEPETKITKIEGIGDLIVLGLPYRTTEPEMKEYFGQFGELDYCEIKVDPMSKKSRGFGFVRFMNDDHAKNVLSTSHRIQGRTCEVRLPRTREEMNVPKKLFVGRLPEGAAEKELEEYFSQFGELTDVYIPKPNRNFGFVTFSSGETAQAIVRQNHRIRDVLLNVSFAEPKANSMRAAGGYPMGMNMGGYNMWNSGWTSSRQSSGGSGGSNSYNSTAGSPYNMMNMMNPSGVQGMMGTGSTNKTWSKGTTQTTTPRK